MCCLSSGLVSEASGSISEIVRCEFSVAGAAGAIGRRLIPQLVARGHQVTASTRGSARLEQLRRLGAEPVVVDGLDAAAVGEAIARSEPDVIVHQMTALAGKANLRNFDKWFATTNKLRTAGTEHLLAAAEAAGVSKFVAQSYTGWSQHPCGWRGQDRERPVRPASLGQVPDQVDQRTAVPGQGRPCRAARGHGAALDCNFYGPGGSESLVELVRKRQMPIIGDGAGVWSWIHLDDAAAATVAAIERGRRGIYNITDDEPAAVAEWLPYLADVVGAKKPLRVPVSGWVGWPRATSRCAG